MPHLNKTKHYFIMECSGDNGSTSPPWPQKGLVNKLCADSIYPDEAERFYDRESAEVKAQQLAVHNPGIRYYVLESVTGFFMPPPAPVLPEKVVLRI